MRNCPARRAGNRTESDLYQCRHWELVRPLRDDANAPKVVVINEAAAKKYFDVTNYARFVLLPENGKTTP